MQKLCNFTENSEDEFSADKLQLLVLKNKSGLWIWSDFDLRPEALRPQVWNLIWDLKEKKAEKCKKIYLQKILLFFSESEKHFYRNNLI